jgi:hypothetical protein
MADLWDKVSPIESGESIDAFLYKADRAVQDILPDLIRETEADARRLREMVDEVGFQPDQFAAQKDEIFRRAFNIRGLAGTLDYPLMGAVAGSMSNLIGRLDQVDDRALTLLKAHADAIVWFLREKIIGDQDEKGLAMLIELRDAAEAYPD